MTLTLSGSAGDTNMALGKEVFFGRRKIVVRGETPDQAMSVVNDTNVLIVRNQGGVPVNTELLEKIFEGLPLNLTEQIGIVVAILPTGYSGMVSTYTFGEDAQWHNKNNIPFNIASSIGIVGSTSKTVEAAL